MLKSLGSAFKKMSQRALWRGDRGQSQILESHGLAGMRSNLLRDTPTYKKDAVGLNGGLNNFSKNTSFTSKNNSNDRNLNPNTKVNTNLNNGNNNFQNSKKLGSSILDSIK